MAQFAAAFRAHQKIVLNEMELRFLATAAIVMDEPCLGQIGSAASGTGLENMQTCRAAFAAAVRAGEIASTKQFLVRKQFKVIAVCRPLRQQADNLQ